MSQEPMLFHGTVADNIRYGRPSATDEEIQQAAVEANAHEFVEKLPDGYQTTVSQVALSAGQRQRIRYASLFLFIQRFDSAYFLQSICLLPLDWR